MSSKSATLNYGNPPYRRTLTNHNKLLNMVDGCIGVKTGFTKKSGRCLVSAVKRDGKFIIAVTLNDPNDWADHKALIEYGLKSIKQTEITPKVTKIEIPVISGEKDSITAEIAPFAVNSLESEGFTCEVYLPKFIYAPIKKGDALGKAVYKQNGNIIAEAEILSKDDIGLCEISKKPLNTVINNFLHIIYNF